VQLVFFDLLVFERLECAEAGVERHEFERDPVFAEPVEHLG
jgi:hypothetical protein